MISTKHGIQKNMKYRILFILFFLTVFVLLFRLSVYSETLSPEAEATETPSATEIISPSPSETEAPTEAPIPSEPTEPASPTAEQETPVPPTLAPNPTLAPTLSPTELDTLPPTATPGLHFLYDFTPPPLNQNHVSDKTLAPDVTPNPTMSAVSIGIVQIDNIDNTKRGVYWSDLIQYAAYCFYFLAGAAIFYGIACLIGLLCFKKDISIGAIQKRRKKRRKESVK